VKRTPDRLSVVIVSHNSAGWLADCLESVYATSGDLDVEIVVVDSGSTDDTLKFVRREFPQVRVVETENHGFAFANNRGLEVVDGQWVLFLNPDTRILTGSLEELVSRLSERPTVGLVGVKQIDEDGVMDPTMRRFPTVIRMFCESLGAERLPFHASWTGQRVLDVELYDRETPCDWTVGSFMLARREAVDEVGAMDERFFLYCEETDLCLRLRQAGWETVHFPQVTIFHQSSRTGSEALGRQLAFARRQYMQKHFGPVRWRLGSLAVGLGYFLRYIAPGRAPGGVRRRAHARTELLTLLGLMPPPFGRPIRGQPYLPSMRNRSRATLGEADD
jgi:GT2 family glycosyltransferase